MRLFLFMILGGLAMVILAGCESVTEILRLAAPLISETVANSLSLQLQDALNTAASGDPIGAHEVKVLSDGIVGALNGALDGAHNAQMAAINAGQEASFWNTMLGSFGGAISGGGSAGVASHFKNRKLVISEPVKS